MLQLQNNAGVWETRENAEIGRKAFLWFFKKHKSVVLPNSRFSLVSHTLRCSVH